MANYFDSSYGRIAYTDQQTGNIPTIFMHGLPTAKELFWPVLPHLDPEIRAVYTSFLMAAISCQSIHLNKLPSKSITLCQDDQLLLADYNEFRKE